MRKMVTLVIETCVALQMTLANIVVASECADGVARTRISLDVPPLRGEEKVHEYEVTQLGQFAHVVGPEGITVWKARYRNARVILSPDGESFLVDEFDQNATVRKTRNPEAVIQLPSGPASDDADAEKFHGWMWLNSRFLLAVSGLRKMWRPGIGVPASEMEEGVLYATMLYLFDVQALQLCRIILPDRVPKVFEVGELRGASVMLSFDGKAVWVSMDLLSRP